MSTETASLAIAPPGLEGLAVAETAIGDVRGREGFYHYRQYSAVELATKRTFEDVTALFLDGALPDDPRRTPSAGMRSMPDEIERVLPAIAGFGAPLDALRTAVSVFGAASRWRPTLDLGPGELRADAARLVTVTPTILAAIARIHDGVAPIPPRNDLGIVANYLAMATGVEPTPERARAVEQYVILMVDHGFNASTFTARVIASTGADLAAAICGAIGSLSGPLHGGAPSRVLDMLDEIGSADRAEAWIRRAVERGDRIMGFGHRVYKTDDPRSVFLRARCEEIAAPRLALATAVESTVLAVLEELKPGRELFTNTEFYASVLLDGCGIDRELFTPTFAVGRVVGWCAHILEQVANNRLIRPAALYVGPPPPEPVPE